MGLRSRLFRPRVLAVVFGTYFAVILFAAWMFGTRLEVPWYGPELSRWVYMTYVVSSAVFLCGSGLIAFKIVDAFEARVREVNRELGKFLWDQGIVLPPGGSSDPPAEDESADSEESFGADLEELLEVLGEVQTEAVQEVLVNSLAANRTADPVEEAQGAIMQRDLLRRRAGLRRHEDYLLRFLVGPVGIAAGMLGTSMIMLPATDGMLQSNFGLNTFLILGFAYTWVGLAAYFGASVLGVASSLRRERKERRKERKRRVQTSDA